MHPSVGALAEKAPPNLLPPSLAFWGLPLKDSYRHLGAAWPVGSGTERWGEGEGWGGPQSLTGVWCVGWHAPCSGSALYTWGVGTTYILLGVRMWGHLGFFWGQDVGTACIMFGVGIWGPSCCFWGQDTGTTWILLGAGTWDPRTVLRDRTRGPFGRDWGQAAGPLTPGSRSGCGDPCMALGVTGGPLLDAQAGGHGDPRIGFGMRGPSCWVWDQDWGWYGGTLTSEPEPGDICIGVRTWGPPYGDHDVSPELSRLETGDGGGRLCPSPSPLQGPLTGDSCTVTLGGFG